MSVSISGIVILVAALALMVNYYLAVQNAEGRLDSKADGQLHNLVKSLEVPLWHYDEETIKHVGSAYAADSVVVLLQITSEQQERYFDYKQPGGRPDIVRVGNIYHDGKLVGFVRIALTSNQVQASTNRLLLSSIAIIALVVVTPLVGTRIILHIFLRKPVADLSAMATAYADTTLPSFERIDEYEEFIGLMTSMKNMGDQIRRQMSDLQTSEDKFRKMADYSPYPLYLIDQKLNITYINQNFHETYGYELEDINTLRKWWDLAYTDEEERAKAKKESAELFLEVVKGSKKLDFTERSITCKNGEKKSVEISMVHIGDTILVHVLDLTRRKRMQEMMMQTEKLISVGGLAAGMAHEINNPLSAVMQGAQNIIRRFSTEMPRNLQIAKKHGIDLDKVNAYMEERDIISHLQGIRESGGRAAQIILNMLKFSRKSESSLAPARVEAVLESAIELAGNDYDLTRKFDFKHIELIRDYDPALDIIICTETEIEQVILNLLKNAAQALKDAELNDPPRITLRTRLNGKNARIEVEDNGPGMTDEIRKRIFEPFFTTKPVGQGTGLGLHVSYTIIANNHNGNLAVESTPNAGTRFIIEIPLDLTMKS